MKFQSHIGRVRGLGSAKDGTHHWWMQRVTGLALVPLTLWFVWTLVGLLGAEYHVVVQQFASPLFSALMIVLVVSLFYHAILGLQVVVEDYIHAEGLKTGHTGGNEMGLDPVGYRECVERTARGIDGLRSEKGRDWHL